MIGDFFNQFLYRPLLNILVIICLLIPGQNFGLAIIATTVLLKVILYPLTKKSLKNGKSLQKIQPELKKIQKKFKGDEMKQAAEIKNLYEKHDINPFSAFVPLLIQFPVLIALYRVFLKGMNEGALYDFVPSPTDISFSFLGINLTNPSVVMTMIAAIIYFFQMKNTSKVKGKSKKGFQDKMPYFFSVFTFFILVKFPAAVSLYLAVSSLFLVTQNYFLHKNESQ